MPLSRSAPGRSLISLLRVNPPGATLLSSLAARFYRVASTLCFLRPGARARRVDELCRRGKKAYVRRARIIYFRGRVDVYTPPCEGRISHVREVARRSLKPEWRASSRKSEIPMCGRRGVNYICLVNFSEARGLLHTNDSFFDYICFLLLAVPKP